METIKVLVQSSAGHDELNVEQSALPGVVAEQLKDDKWVTLEKKDGSTEILTKADLPSDKIEDEAEDDVDEELDDEDKALQKAGGWADTFKETKNTKGKVVTAAKFESRFENVESATATHKAKGG